VVSGPGGWERRGEALGGVDDYEKV